MDIHLVSSPSAAGTLRHAIDRRLLDGETWCADDRPEVGPLDDGRGRAAFWRMLLQDSAMEPDGPDRVDFFAPWQALRARLRGDGSGRVLIWASDSGSDQVLLRMACHFLGEAQLVQVPVPPRDGLHAVALHDVDALLACLPRARALDRTVVTQWAHAFRQMAARPDTLRESDPDGVLVFRPLSAHDGLLLGACTEHWQDAARVVGGAMRGCDPRNPLGDTFLAWRLRRLVADGRLQADAPALALRGFRVRRPQPAA